MSRKVTIAPPLLSQVSRIAEEAGFTCSEEELKEYQELMTGSLADYSRVFDLPEPKLPVKYPRDLGSIYKPAPEENPCNAWSMRMSIKGAETGKLSGKRIAIKDNCQVAGVSMTNGSELLRGFVPTEDATIVTRILDEGGHIIGTTNTTDMCVSGVSLYGANGPVLNPCDKTRSCGGSSSGSGVVLKLGEADMAIGCDQGGSIRIPASWCGIVGLKPTWGLVPYTGIVPIESTLDHVGPMARTVADCALMLEVLAGYDDGLDPRQPRDLAVPKYTEKLDQSLSGRKIGFVTEGFLNCESEVSEIVKSSFKYFEAAGITVEEVSVPWHKDGKIIWTPPIFEGTEEIMLKRRGVEMGTKGHKRTELVDHMHNTMQTKANYIARPLKFVSIMGRYILETAGPAYYARAHNLLRTLTKKYDDALEKYDVLLMPTLPYVAPKQPEEEISTKDAVALCFGMVANTAPFDSTGHPALSINAGFTTDGHLPVGLQIVGRQFDEQTVLAYAHAFETNRDTAQ